MIWVGVWVLLVLLAGAVFALLGRSVWGRSKLLIREAGDAAARLGEATARIEVATGTTVVPEPAVFERPAELRRARAGRPTGRGRHLGATGRAVR